MKIFANKEIKKIVSCSIRYLGSLPSVDTGIFYGCAISGFSLFLLLVFVLAGGAILAVGCSYFKKSKNQVMEQAVSQINAYLDGDHNARIECDEEGELYRVCFILSILWRLC